MAYIRKTELHWRFFVNYGNGWEHECTELTRADMKENRKLYRENCQYPFKIVAVNEPLDTSYVCPCCR